MIITVNKSPTSSPNQSLPDTEPMDSSLVDYLKAAKDQLPSRESLIAEVHAQRVREQNKKNTIKSATAILIGAGILWGANPVIDSETYITQFAQQKQVTLPDGSNIRLNANSEVLAELKLRSREMRLKKGEASFTVNHGMRPFYVHVDEASILDVGTVFNIQKWDDFFIVTVEDGEIEVLSNKTTTKMKVGESIKVSKLGIGSVVAADLDTVTAWQSGKIVFNGTPLKDAVANIQRYKKEPITLDESVANLRLSGSYDINKLEPLLNSFASLFPVNINRHADGAVEIRKK